MRPPRNTRKTQEEHFKVVSGRMGYVLEGVKGSLEAGQEVSVKAGLSHGFYNAAPEKELVIEVTMWPAVRPSLAYRP